MDKSIKLKDLYVGQLITRGTHEEAQVYTIAEINRLEVLLKWKEGTHECQQWSDYCDCYLPTLKQIEYSIHQNGPLVSAADI
jgi:hypothetical protein